MDALIPLIIGLVIGIAVGAAAGIVVARSRRPMADDSVLVQRAASAEATAAAQREQIERLVAQAEADRERAEQDAEDESKVLLALSPVQEQLRVVQNTVAELERQRSVQYGQIAEQLAQTKISGDQIRATTESLASALRNNGTRGVWGEAQLRNVVEAAGLTNRVDFDLQSTISSDSGRGRPDMIVHLPGGKSIAVDAKVPFDAYLEANAIPLTAPDHELARRKALLDKHVKAVRMHIDALAGKAYWNGLDASPEFVVAFIPSESLLASALEADSSLLDYSFRKKVALASPVNLWAVLKTVSLTWQQDLLTEDAKVLFDLGQKLFDRVKTMAGHADSMRSAIERTVKSYNEFASSLESRVLVTARQMNSIDESKIIPELEMIESTPRTLTQPELQAAPAQETIDADPATDDVFEPKTESPDDEFELISLDELRSTTKN